MKIQKTGKSVTLERDEIETLVKHVVEFEKITKALERADAAGKLPAELKRTWSSLKKFMDAEEARVSGSPTPRARKVRCCILSNLPLTNVVDCQELNSSFVFALAACLLRALVGGFGATLVAGKCSDVAGCP